MPRRRPRGWSPPSAPDRERHERRTNLRGPGDGDTYTVSERHDRNRRVRVEGDGDAGYAVRDGGPVEEPATFASAVWGRLG